MASSFEKSVKGATKIKVSSTCPWPPVSVTSVHTDTLVHTGRATEDEVHRAHSCSNTCWRSGGRRSLQGIAEQITRFYVDRRFQESDNSTPYDTRRLTGRYVGIFGKTQEHTGR
jgi:hypothetical protein